MKVSKFGNNGVPFCHGRRRTIDEYLRSEMCFNTWELNTAISSVFLGDFTPVGSYYHCKLMMHEVEVKESKTGSQSSMNHCSYCFFLFHTYIVFVDFSDLIGLMIE